MSSAPSPDVQPVTLTWLTASIERHEPTAPLGTLRTCLGHARERTDRPNHPDYARDLDLLKDTWLGANESEILEYRHIRRITGLDVSSLPPVPMYTVTGGGVAGYERCHDGRGTVVPGRSAATS